MDQSLIDHEIDLAIKMHNPLGEKDWAKEGLSVNTTTPSTMIYLFGLGSNPKVAVGRDLVQLLWEENRDHVLSPSESFLPFNQKDGLSRAEFLESLPERTSPVLRIMCPENYFTVAFLEQLRAGAKKIGTVIQFTEVPASAFFQAFNDPKASEKFDYILSSYFASERYPAVQLRYLTRSTVWPPIDLKKAEAPDFVGDRATIFKNYEKWLLSSQNAIPLYFNVTLFRPSDLD